MMSKTHFFLLLFFSIAYGKIEMGPEFSISAGVTDLQDHRLGNICALPNGHFAVAFLTSDYSGYAYSRNLFTTLVSENAVVTTPLLLSSDEDPIYGIKLNSTSNSYLISYCGEYYQSSPSLSHQWMSLNNQPIGDVFFSYPRPAYNMSHLNTLVLPDKKVVTLLNKSNLDLEANQYFEILQANGQSWALEEFRRRYGTQICLLSSGHLFIHWYYEHKDQYGNLLFPHTVYFEIRNENGTVLHSDSTRNSKYVSSKVLGLEKGGFAACYWKEDKNAAFVQAFSDQLAPQSLAHDLEGIENRTSSWIRTAELSDGTIALLWYKRKENNKYDLCLNLVSLSTGCVYANSKINASDVLDAFTICLLPLPHNKLLISWTGSLPGQTYTSICAKIYNADGTVHTDEFLVAEGANHRDKKYVFVANKKNTVLFCWEAALTDYPWQQIDGRFVFIRNDTNAAIVPPPTDFTVKAGFPNPFNSQTTILFTLPSPGSVDIHIYNVSGQVVYEDNFYYTNAGHHFIIWNGCDMSQQPQPSGCYFVKITFSDNTDKLYSSVQKIVLSR